VTGQLHQDSLSELKREIDAITCEGCRRNEPIIIHDGTPTSMAALKGMVFHTSGRCTSKAHEFLPLFDSIAAKAFEIGAQHEPIIFGSGAIVACRKHDWKANETVSFAEHIKFLSPASARRQLQLDLLRARLDEAKWWHTQRGHHGHNWCCERVAQLESEIAALEAQK